VRLMSVLSRQRHGFEPRWDYQYKRILCLILLTLLSFSPTVFPTDEIKIPSKNERPGSLRASENDVALVEKINIYAATTETSLAIERINPKEIFQILQDEFSTQLNIRLIEDINTHVI
jgi:hypothetical protein